jgi:hypothetical protein
MDGTTQLRPFPGTCTRMLVPGRKVKGESDDAGPGNYLNAGG